MKHAGIIRKLDPLGRITLPIELRKTMHLEDGTPLELFVDKDTDMICLRKYDMQGNYDAEILRLVDAIKDDDCLTHVERLALSDKLQLAIGDLRRKRI